MKKYIKVFLSISLTLLLVLLLACSNDNSSIAKKNIEEFLNNKSALYDKKDKLISILDGAPIIPLELEDGKDYRPDIQWEKSINETFKDVKILLSEKAYDKLSRNRYFLDTDLIDALREDKYDKSEIGDIEYEKLSESDEEIVYSVKYIEKLYLEGKIKKEENHMGKFTLEKIDNKWLISRIE